MSEQVDIVLATLSNMPIATLAELIDNRQVADALVVTTKRFTRLLRSVRSPEAPATDRWSIRDVAAHTLWGIENYTRWAKGEAIPSLGDLHGIARWNLENVREVEERDLAKLATRIDGATHELISFAESLDPHEPLIWYCGQTLPTNVFLAMRVIETVLHGFDIARADRQPWPIERPHGLLVAYAGAYIAPLFVNQEQAMRVGGSLEVRWRGGARVLFAVHDGRVTVSPVQRSHADCHMSADPVAWILTSSRRASRVVASMTGRITAWGRKPWLPLRFHRLFIQG